MAQDQYWRNEIGKYMDEQMHAKTIEAWLAGDARIQQQMQSVLSALPYLVETVVDMGCGSGKFTAMLSKQAQVNFVIGIDFSPAALRATERTVKEHGVPAKVALCNALCNALPISNCTIDLCLMIDILEHLPPPLT